MENKLKIALTFSGGGYRAATFHLGVLSYLDQVKAADSTLLNHVTALSTISGGTITGLRYMLGLSRGEPTAVLFTQLYDFLLNTDLVTSALDNLSTYEEEQSASLIRTMAGIYNEHLFKGAVFGDLMEQLDRMPVTHFSANATDFTNGLPFRFQLTEKIRCFEGTGYEFGLIGNNTIRLPRDVARHIRLSEILACSSCFPSGFEPMVFPQDFVLGSSLEVKEFCDKNNPFGIMDGGIVDNQGIEPIVLAEKQMRNDRPEIQGKCLDLIIISDVASPYMDAYQPADIQLPKALRNLSINKISRILCWTEVITLILAGGSFFCGIPLLTNCLIVVWLFTTVVWGAYSLLKKYITKLAGNSIIRHSVPSVLNLKAGDLVTLIVNRVNSVLELTSTVFMKHIRRLEYNRVYNDPGWKNRSITNAIYELRENEKWKEKIEKGTISTSLMPGTRIQENSHKAAAVGTTLWFTDEDKACGIPDALLAAGQYTMCWNLLEYIEKIRKNPANLNKNHQTILDCEPQLRADWEKFQQDPLYNLSGFKS